MEAATPQRRSDALRNDERILEGAMRELGRNPTAGMNELAGACGVSRATLFRRYPSREALIDALREVAHEDLRAAVDGADLTAGSPPDALARLIDALLEVGSAYSFLLQNGGDPTHRAGTSSIS